MSYTTEFREALERTTRLGLRTPPVGFAGGRRLTPETAGRIWPAVEAHIGGVTLDRIKAQCLSFHLEVKQAVERALSCPCYFTIGHVVLAGDSYFQRSEDELKELLKCGVSGPSVRLHAWLTLPTMELLDFVFPTSYAEYNGFPEGRMQTIAEHGDHMPAGISFHPMLVGSEFLIRIGAFRVAI
jgi:hypothetical protein